MKLSDLSTDALSLILALGNSHLAILLWKCGNRALNGRFSNGGCTQVSLKDTRPFSTSRFPKMLLALRCLRSLEIDRGKGYLMPASDLPNTLLQLSSLLETLKLTCNGAVEVFINYPSNPRSLPESDTTSSDASLSANLWSMRAAWPVLSTLKLHEQAPLIPLTNEHLSALPPTLTHLELNQLVLRSDKLDVSLLPPALQYLRIGATPFLISSLAHMPSTLSDIGGSSWYSIAAGALPPTVTNATPCSLSSFSQIASVPRALQSLSVDEDSSISDDQFLQRAAYFPSLTTLAFSFAAHGGGKKVMHFNDILALPRTLTTLSMPPIHWESLTTADTSLDRATLPWPSNLTSLSINAPSIYGNPPPRYDWSRLPSNLKILKLHNYSFDEALAEDQGYFDTLPRSLTDIDIDFSVSMTTFFTIEKRLPPNLKALMLPTIHPSSFEYFPRTLELFSVNLNCIGPNICPYIRPMVTLEATIAVSAFPACLLYLHASIPPSTFKHLPRTLTHLVASHHHGEEVLKSYVQALPRTLIVWISERISIKFAKNALEDFSLPPNLETLHAAVPDCRYRVPASMLAFLPSSLVSLCIAVKDLQPEHLWSLPCRNNLQWAWFDEVTHHSTSFIEMPGMLDAWPENALLKLPPGFDIRHRREEAQNRNAKIESLWKRAQLYPDPRILSAATN